MNACASKTHAHYSTYPGGNHMTTKIAFMACAAVAALAAPAAAQTTSGATSGNRLEEIIVTATRREERLQTVPIAVTAIDAKALERSNIVDVRQIQFLAPGLNLQAGATDRSAIQASMRGLYVGDAVPTVDPAVGIYLNGVYLARTPGLNASMVDLQRVEVLRGPQGTVFGRNTIGGAINFVPNEPTDRFEGSLSASAGNLHLGKVEGVVNVPVAENVSVRLVGGYSSRGALGHNLLLRSPLSNDKTKFFRGSLKGQFGQFTNLLVYEYNQLKGGPISVRVIDYNRNATCPGSSAECFARAAGDTLANYTSLPFYDNKGSVPGHNIDAHSYTISNTLSYDLGWATAKSISAYRYMRRTAAQNDTDGTPFAILDSADGGGDRSRQFSQELQLYGAAFDGKVDWITGVYYFQERGRNGPSPSVLLGNRMSTDGSAKNFHRAAFAQVSWEFIENWKATAGYRYAQDKRNLVSRNRTGPADACAVPVALFDRPGLCQATLPTRTFTYSPWLLSLSWTPRPDLMIYGKVTRGMRAGGYNLRVPGNSVVDFFGPEAATQYEAGVKADFLDKRLRTNLALFQTKYDNIQLTQRVTIGGTLANRTQNVGKANIEGGELEITALPIDGLRLTASASIADSKYTQLLPGATATLNDHFLGAPRQTYAFSANYLLNTAFGETEFNVDYSWRDIVWNSQARAAAVPAYGLVNGQIAFTPQGNERMRFTLWGRNLTAKKYYMRTLDLGSVILGNPGEPRTYGVTATYNF
jgi:iron complex outermembrane receptor protein